MVFSSGCSGVTNGFRAFDSLVIEPASVVDRYNVSSFLMERLLFGNQFASMKFKLKKSLAKLLG